MAIGDEQIDRLTRGVRDALEQSIEQLREMLKGVTINITATASIDAHEVKPTDGNKHAS